MLFVVQIFKVNSLNQKKNKDEAMKNRFSHAAESD